MVNLFDEALHAPLCISLGSDPVEVEEALLSSELMDTIRHITSYPSKDEILQEFNAYVRGPLRDSVMNRLGSEVEIPLKLCMVGALPVLFSLPLYSCEAHNCHVYANHLGLTSATPLIYINASLNMVSITGTLLMRFPLQMRGSAFIAHKVIQRRLQLFLVFLLGISLQLLLSSWVCLVNSIGLVVAANYSPSWLLALLTCLAAHGC